MANRHYDNGKKRGSCDSNLDSTRHILVGTLKSELSVIFYMGMDMPAAELNLYSAM